MLPSSEHLKSMHHQDGSVILDVVQGTLTTLNTTGGSIWQSLQDGISEEEIVARLMREFPEDAEEIAEDVRAFREALQAHRLLPQLAVETLRLQR